MSLLFVLANLGVVLLQVAKQELLFNQYLAGSSSKILRKNSGKLEIEMVA